MLRKLPAIVVLYCCTLSAPAQGLAEDFPSYRGPESSGIADPGPGLAEKWPEGGPPVLWRSDDLGTTGWDHDKGQVVVADGRVYAYTRKQIDGQWSRHVTCLATDGQTLWQHAEPARTPSGPQTPSPALCISEGRVFGAPQWKTFCLDAKSGRVIWSHDTGRCGIPSPLVVGNVLVYHCKLGLQGISTEDGRLQWTVKARGGASLQSPTVWQTPSSTYVIAVLDEYRQCVCVDPTTGAVLWDLALDQGEDRIKSDTRLCQATPTVGEGYLILQRSDAPRNLGIPCIRRRTRTDA